jgi:uncharacterized protein (DUF1499 family)
MAMRNELPVDLSFGIEPWAFGIEHCSKIYARLRLMLTTGLILALASVVLLAAGPLGTRAGLWPFGVGFVMLALALLLALAAIGFAVTDARRTHRWPVALATIVVALIPLALPVVVIAGARGKPAIHDISTDMVDPPAFVDVLRYRTGNVSPAAYDGPEAAAAQRRAYPDIKPLVVARPVPDAVDRASALVRDRGWQLVTADRTTGRVEAIDTTYWFGFKDDVVIRVRAEGNGARVDMRSKSRVGVGDLGTNARRISEFLRDLAGRT